MISSYNIFGMRFLAILLGLVILSEFIHAHAQQSMAVYLYDDLGRLAKVVERSTGDCAIYKYDAVGNLLSITRLSNCAVPPLVETLTAVPENNSFTLTGQNLLGATVSVNIPGVYVADVRATDTTLKFRLRGSEIVCSSVGKAVISTPFGSVETTVTRVGAAHLTLGKVLPGTIAQVGQTNFYCLELLSPIAGLVEVVPAAGSSLKPCVSVFRDVKGAPIRDGTACATANAASAIVDTDIASGLHFIAVSGANFTTGAYTLVVRPPLVLAQVGVDVVLPHEGPTSGLAITLSAPIVEAALPDKEGTTHFSMSFARPIVDVVFPAKIGDAHAGGVTVAVPAVEVNFEGVVGLLNVPARGAPDDGKTNSAPRINQTNPK